MSQSNEDDNQKLFNSLANDWWDKDGPMKTLHDLNPVRLKYLEKKVELKNAIVADIGCGGGILSESVAKAGASVVGIDTSTELVQIARHHAALENLEIRYESSSVSDLAKQESGKYDVVLCMELVEHVDDIYELLSGCAKLLKSEGILFISTLNRSLWSYLFGVLAAEDLLKIVPKGTHDYNKFIKPSELSACCRAVGFIGLDMKGLSYNPFTRKTRLSKFPLINYICSFSAV